MNLNVYTNLRDSILGMNDTIEKESDVRSKLPRIGRVIMWIGIVFLIVGVSSMFAISSLYGIGVIVTAPNYQILNTIALSGIILSVIGVIVRYGSSTLSKDGIWSLQTGPYIK